MSQPTTPPPTQPVRPSGLRRGVEAASLPLLTRLSRLPRLVPFLVLLGLMVGGVVIGGPGGATLTAAAAVFVAWLLYLSWPRLTSSERLMRSAVLLLAVAIAVTQAFPRT